MLEIASASSLDPEVRLLSFEWVSTLTAATKGLLKVVTDFPIRVLSVAFLFLCEVGDDDESDDGLHKEGEAKVDFFVKKLSFKVSVKPLMTPHCPPCDKQLMAREGSCCNGNPCFWRVC